MSGERSWRRAVLAGGAVAAVAAACLVVASQLGVQWLRDVVDLLAEDRRVVALDRFSDTALSRILLGTAAAAGATAAGLFACRRSLAQALAVPTTPPSWRSARVGASEATVAAVVIIGAMAFAAGNLLLPARADESHSITALASQSFWHAWSTYDTPNNHVLHTLLLWVVHRLAGWDLVALRMPAFLAACLVLPATWWFVRREYGWPPAAFATALLGTSPLFVEYATNARGYTLMLLFSVAALACGSEAARRPEAVRWWAGYAAALGLGFFTVPLMAFPAAVAACWMLLLHWRARGRAALPRFALRLAGWSAAGLGLAALLYVPVLLEWGPASLLDNHYVQSVRQRDTWWSAGRLAARVAVGPWLSWHLATPPWVQLALLVAVAAGVVTPAPGRRRGMLAVAAVAGTVAVLLAKPVVLAPRMTLWMLLVCVVMAGAGAAVLWEAALERTKLAVRRRAAAHAVAAAAVFGVFAWPTTGENSARDTHWAVLQMVFPHLGLGDCLLTQPSLTSLVSSEVLFSGFGLSPSRTNSSLLEDRPLHVRRIDAALAGGQRKIGAGNRIWLFVDDNAKRWKRRGPVRHSAPELSVESVELLLQRNGYEYSVLGNVVGGKLLRLEGLEDLVAGGRCEGIGTWP